MRLACLASVATAALAALCTPEASAASPMTVRAGETIAVSVGQEEGLSRPTLTVTITPAGGSPLVYEPGASIVRAVVFLFPDPVSRLAVEAARRPPREATADAPPSAAPEGAQTIVYVTLPPTLPPGIATVVISGPDGRSFAPLEIDVVRTPTTPPGGAGEAEALADFERAEHHTVSFTGPSVFHSAQIVLTYDPGGERPLVVNARPSVKNVAWSDDGATLRVLLTPADGRTPSTLEDFTFHVAGAVPGLRVVAVRAYDVNGAGIAGVTVDLR